MSESVQCDYLVVGGGAAGCIVARRLAERADSHVILTEAGRSDEGDPVAMELARLDEQDESYDWGYLAQPTSTSTHQHVRSIEQATIFLAARRWRGTCSSSTSRFT